VNPRRTRSRTPEYVTRNDELLAGDARQSLMRNDSVKLDKRVVATWPNGGQQQEEEEVHVPHVPSG